MSWRLAYSLECGLHALGMTSMMPVCALMRMPTGMLVRMLLPSLMFGLVSKRVSIGISVSSRC